MEKHSKKLGHKPSQRVIRMVNRALGREVYKEEQFEREDRKFVTTPKKKKMLPLYTVPITPPKKKKSKCEEAFDNLLKGENIRTDFHDSDYGRLTPGCPVYVLTSSERTVSPVQRKIFKREDNDFGSVLKKRKKLFQDDDDDSAEMARCSRSPGRPFTSSADLWSKSPVENSTSPVQRAILSPVSQVQRKRNISKSEDNDFGSVLKKRKKVFQDDDDDDFLSSTRKNQLSPEIARCSRSPMLSPVSHVQRKRKISKCENCGHVIKKRVFQDDDGDDFLSATRENQLSPEIARCSRSPVSHVERTKAVPNTAAKAKQEQCPAKPVVHDDKEKAIEKRKAWTGDEEERLVLGVEKYGLGSWYKIAEEFHIDRPSKHNFFLWGKK